MIENDNIFKTIKYYIISILLILLLINILVALIF